MVSDWLMVNGVNEPAPPSHVCQYILDKVTVMGIGVASLN